jgi:DNA helicase HerA-like ATPase
MSKKDKLLLSDEERQSTLPAFDEMLLFSLERRYLDIVDSERLELTANPAERDYDYQTHLRMMKIDEVSHEGESDLGLHLLNMQNVLAAMKDDSQNVVSVIHGTKEKTSLYYGLSKRIGSTSDVGTPEYAEILRQTFHGNFLGAKLTPLSAEDIKNDIFFPMSENQNNVRAFPGIPSLRLKDPRGPYVQGIDRFIEGMRGEEYCLVAIAEPISLPEIDGVIQNLFDLGTSIHSQVKATVQNMKGSSDTVNIGLFGMSADNRAHTESTADTVSENYMEKGGLMQSGGGVILGSMGGIIGGIVSSVIPVVGTFIGASIGAGVGNIISSGLAYFTGSPLGRTESFTKSVADTVGKTTGFGGQGGYARGWNRSRAVTQEMLNKTAEHCGKLCDAYIERLQGGKNLGFWNVGVYLMTKNRYTQLRAQGLLRAALSGDATYWEPIRSVKVNSEAVGKYLFYFNNPKYNLFLYGTERQELRKELSTLQKIKKYAESIGDKFVDVWERLRGEDENAVKMLEEIRRRPDEISKEELDKAWAAIDKAELGHPFGEMMGGVSTPMNTEELSIIMNVPRQEVQGLTIREAASFGVNYLPSPEDDDIAIGKVIHKRTPMDNMPYKIPKNLFQKHAFVCGVTGSGKTNTCVTLLRKLGLPFMVIEPAKTEYRQMLSVMPDLQVFTLGSEMISPFRLNPFEFSPGSELLTHIDSIKAVFNAAFPMYASMPYILEESIIDIYRDKGWDLAASTNRYLEDLKSGEFFDYLPTLQDLYEKIPSIVKEKAYAEEVSSNIKAALMARLSSLLTGSKGLMLNTRRSTPIGELLTKPVVLELKNIGDDDEKCFMMGLILAAIYQHRENSGKLESAVNHVLLIEEAHRLLRRTPEFVSPEVGDSRGKAVETFTNVISEIRAYGQGVIIVDQIPSKLTPDVVKNTNIKFIHRTLAQDDRDYVGSTMNLTDAQKRELCLLEVGQSVIHREGADKAFLVQIEQSKGKNKDNDWKIVTDEEIRQYMKMFRAEHSNVFARHPGFEKMEGIAEAYAKEDFRKYSDKAFFGVTGALVVMMTGEADALKNYKERFFSLLKREFRVEDDLRRACYLIHYTQLLFGNLNESFPGCFDRCVRLNRLFIDAWFGEPCDTGRIKEDVVYITGVSSPYDAFLHKYVEKRAADREAEFKTLKAEDFTAAVAEDLSAMLNDMLLGVKLSDAKTKELLSELLTVLFRNNPRKKEIFSAFKASFGENL